MLWVWAELMRRYLVTAAVVLVLHGIATILFRPYSGILVDVGGLFIHNTDIASLWDRLVAGFSLVAGALILAAIVMMYLRSIWARASEAPTAPHPPGGAA